MCSSWRVDSSSAENGSSISSSLGCRTSDRAMATRWRMPPESSWTRCPEVQQAHAAQCLAGALFPIPATNSRLGEPELDVFPDRKPGRGRHLGIRDCDPGSARRFARRRRGSLPRLHGPTRRSGSRASTYPTRTARRGLRTLRWLHREETFSRASGPAPKPLERFRTASLLKGSVPPTLAARL